VSAASLLVAALSLVGGASSAFAGWTPQRTAPTAAQLAAAKAYCAKDQRFPGLPLKLIDARGPFTTAVYSDASSNDFYSFGPSFRHASGWSTSPPVMIPSGRIFLWGDHLATVEGQPYGTMIARVADDVTAAITLDNGAEVTATVQNGWAVAVARRAPRGRRAADDALGHADPDVPAVPMRRAQLQRRRSAWRHAGRWSGRRLVRAPTVWSGGRLLLRSQRPGHNRDPDSDQIGRKPNAISVSAGPAFTSEPTGRDRPCVT
jgi:hypothetical protein